MKSRITLLFLLLVDALVYGQAGNELIRKEYTTAFQSIIADAVTNKPLKGATIINRRINQYASSDSNGRFSITAHENDLLLIQDAKYISATVLVKAKLRSDTIFLQPKSYPVEKLSAYDRFKRDSIENRTVYRKVIADAKRKPIGIFFPPFFIYGEGFLSELARSISGQKKRDRSLLHSIVSNEQQSFVALKYNLNTVKQVLPLDDSLASDFIARHPMPYEFAASASDLDIYRWIKDQSLAVQR